MSRAVVILVILNDEKIFVMFCMKSATIIFTIISTRYVKTYYKLIKLTLKIITKEKSKVTHKFK